MARVNACAERRSKKELSLDSYDAAIIAQRAIRERVSLWTLEKGNHQARLIRQQTVWNFTSTNYNYFDYEYTLYAMR